MVLLRGLEIVLFTSNIQGKEKNDIYDAKKKSRLWLLSIGTLLIILGGLVGIWQINTTSHAHAASSLPYHMTADGPYHVQGNTILDTQGQPYLFHGMGRDGLEYSCTGDGPLDAKHLAYVGAGANSSSGTYWWGNTIRLPISEGFWLHGDTANGCSAAQYQTLVKTTISTINTLGLNAILDLQWVDAGGHSSGAGSSWPSPDADSLIFWQQAATLYKSTPNVLFEIYNEPNPPTWACWQAGCSITSTTYADSCSCHITATYQAVGMQALVNAIRAVGATNLILAAGLNYGFDLSGVSTTGLTGSNIVYDTHPYPYVGKETQPNWDASFGTLSATTAVISTESGEYDCKNTFESSLLSYFDSHQISWMGWAWSVQGTPTSVCGYPQAITDYQGTPAALMGQTEYQHLLSYVPAGTQPPPPPGTSTPPNTPPGPVQKTWYFAEGRVGKGFREYLTVENPSGNVCSVALNYNYTPDGGAPATKAVPITVNPYSRFTESVNTDLGDADSGTSAASVASSVNVNATITPTCSGVVVERPMYFHNFRGISSGTDVVGANQLSTTYSFADVPTSSTMTSYLTILNPNSTSANVTVSYSANGKVVGSQTTTVPANARGTIAPGSINLPAHVAAVVTASQPVLVERPTYFSGVSMNRTPISGAYDIIGAASLANDWLFAEGYTSTTSQEYLTIANVDPAHASANVTITLKSKTGVTHAFPITVGAQSQTIWNVNANNTFTGSSPEVSAEVVSTGAQIVVQREMYFTYHHTLTNGRQTTALGGTDVMGQVGPAAHSAYSFAEGYANTGYNDWLTIQNPTTSAESIAITLVNGLGQSSVQNVTVPANARFTEDLASVVQSVFHAGTNSSANSFSMTVQTLNNAVFVAERPIYFNTNGVSSFAVQGGNDCIGYVGG